MSFQTMTAVWTHILKRWSQMSVIDKRTHDKIKVRKNHFIMEVLHYSDTEMKTSIETQKLVPYSAQLWYRIFERSYL